MLVRQVDHQDQCAPMAAAWGNARFARIAPFEPSPGGRASTMRAGAPGRGPRRCREGAPVDFTEIDRATHVALYRGDRRRRARDARAGLLVSMHGQGLYEGRGWPRPRPADAALRAPAGCAGVPGRAGRGPGRACGARSGRAGARRLGVGRLPAAADLGLPQPLPDLARPAGGARATLPQVPREAGDPGLDLRVGPTAPWPCTWSPGRSRATRWTCRCARRAVEDRPYADAPDLGEPSTSAPLAHPRLRVRPG